MVAAGERVSGRTADPYKFGHSLWDVADSVLAEVAEVFLGRRRRSVLRSMGELIREWLIPVMLLLVLPGRSNGVDFCFVCRCVRRGDHSAI